MMTTTTPDCDTAAYIARHLGSLEDLHELRQERSAWFKENNENRNRAMNWLHKFIVLRRFILTENGALCALEKPINDPDMPAVVTEEDWRKHLYRGESISYGYDKLPEATDECAVCGVKFNLDTATDAYAVEHVSTDAPTPRPFETRFAHSKCEWMNQARKNRTAFEQMFVDAGFFNHYLEDIENGYWPPAYKTKPFYSPWFRAHTQYGVIIIGWRKRVISIDWSETKRDLLHLFKDLDVTKDRHMIHAWGPEEAVARLATIRGALSPQASCECCERCTWNEGPDCGKSDHQHCAICGHCEGRHKRTP